MDNNIDLNVDIGANVSLDLAYSLLAILPFENRFKVKYEPAAFNPRALEDFDRSRLYDLDLITREEKNNALSSVVDGEDGTIILADIGDINMKSTNSLIQDSETLFGGKVKLRFGKLTLTTAIAQQKGSF